MDAGLISLMTMACRKALLPLLLGMVSAVAAAEDFPDPTQPPAGIYSGPATGQGSAVVMGQAVSPTRRGLQSVIISPERRAAIINGETVELGGMVGRSRLVEVNESGVVLQGVRGRQVLALFPGVWLKAKAAVPPPAVQKR